MSWRRLFALCLRRVAETGLKPCRLRSAACHGTHRQPRVREPNPRCGWLTVGIGMRWLREAMERLSLSTGPKECASPQLVHLASHLPEG